jgi:hypothetical protein
MQSIKYSRCNYNQGRFFALMAGLAISMLVQSPVYAVDGALPGGTAISVTIDSASDSGAGVEVQGTASVEAGTPIKDTTLVYVMDVSGSMTVSAGVDCTGDAVNDTRLVCEKYAIAAANQAASQPFSAVDLTGLASFNSSATAHDVDLSATTSLLVAPDYDGNTTGGADVEEVAFSLSAGGQTNYADGLRRAFDIVNDPANNNSTNLIIFLSDADRQSVFVGSNVGIVPPDTTIKAIGIGSGVTCTYNGGTGTLNDVAALSTVAGTGECIIVSDISELADEITQSIGSSLNSLSVSVDGGAPAVIGNADISPDLPHDGPVIANYLTNVGMLNYADHEICVTAYGSDAGGNGNVTDCIMLDLTLNIDIDIKPGSYPNSINVERSQGKIPVALFGSAAFDVTLIDRSTVRFGPGDAMPVHKKKGHLQDSNEDGYMDLLVHFPTPEAGIAPGDASACVHGSLLGGMGNFVSCDSVRTVPVH